MFGPQSGQISSFCLIGFGCIPTVEMTSGLITWWALKERKKELPHWLERFWERIWMSWRRQWFRQRKSLLRLLGSWRNKRRNTRRMKRKGWLWLPWHLQKTVALQRSVRRKVKDPKRRKNKSSRRLPGGMEWKIHPPPSPNPRKGDLFPRKSWLVVILNRQLAVEVFPRGNLSPKRNQLVILKSQKTRGSLRKRENSLPRNSHSAEDLKRLLPTIAAVSRKNKKLQKLPQEN